jgi:hypothetical protein
VPAFRASGVLQQNSSSLGLVLRCKNTGKQEIIGLFIEKSLAKDEDYRKIYILSNVFIWKFMVFTFFLM